VGPRDGSTEGNKGVGFSMICALPLLFFFFNMVDTCGVVEEKTVEEEPNRSVIRYESTTVG
jgi:hypothetical protein